MEDDAPEVRIEEMLTVAPEIGSPVSLLRTVMVNGATVGKQVAGVVGPLGGPLGL